MSEPFSKKHLLASYKHKKFLSSLTQALFQRMNLSFFGYSRYYKDKTWFGLYSDPDIVRNFLDGGLRPIMMGEDCFLVKDGTYYGEDLKHLLEPYIPKEEFRSFYKKDLDYDNLNQHGFYIFRSNAFYLESFFFSSTTKDLARSHYLKNIEELGFFITHFLYKARKIIAFSETNKNICPVYKKNDSSLTDLLLEIYPTTKYSIPTPLGDRHLSKQENNCIKLIAKGYKRSQIAKKLAISNKTVDSYIENIKNKTNYLERNDFVKVCNYLNFLKY